MDEGLRSKMSAPIVPEEMDWRWLRVAMPVLMAGGIAFGIPYFMHSHSSSHHVDMILWALPAAIGSACYKYRQWYMPERPARLDPESEELAQLKDRRAMMSRGRYWCGGFAAIVFGLSVAAYNGTKDIPDRMYALILPGIVGLAICEGWVIGLDAYIKSLVTEPKVRKMGRFGMWGAKVGKRVRTSYWEER